MYIEPNTNIKILHNVPLDTTYNHTIFFANESAQIAYFSSLTKYNLTQQTYQRVQRGSCRVQIKAENLYDCNYLMFQNTNFGTKWFYAFIESVEYINNEVSLINFTIDVMQTWFFDYQLQECFVDREHSATDGVGDNIIEENIPIGDYFEDAPIGTGLFDYYSVVLVSPYDFKTLLPISRPLPYPDYYPELITENVSCLHSFYGKGASTYESCQHLQVLRYELQEAGYEESILCFYLVPSGFLPQTPVETDIYNCARLPEGTVTRNVIFAAHKPLTVGDYGVPRNKKLLTYPFTKFSIQTFDGNVNDYCYEYFDSTNVVFKIYSNLTTNASFKCVPLDYKNVEINVDEGALLTDLPLVAYYTDTFKAWLAQNKTRIAFQSLTGGEQVFNGLGDVISGSQMKTPVRQNLSAKGARKMSGGIASIGEGLARGIGSSVVEAISARHLPNKPHGSADGSLEIAMGIKDFNYIHKYVNPAYAKIIDDYFDMYGYATKEVKVPNRNVRAHWTYTKTIGCVIKGSVPCDDMREICNIYDNGITFWVNGSEVGNYSLANSVL